ncbi:MAG: DUF87 domain-containing protein [Candidatus Babeliaceae bacterium]|nr:DUF87 domain-containing protein [Candidatus Babeliaceae bacterium]
MRQRIGTILSGSLSEGFVMRINGTVPLEKIKAGRFVSIVSPNATFFSLITDLQLGISNPDIFLYPPEDSEKTLLDAITPRALLVKASIRPLLMLENGHRMPVKSIPHHFAPVFEASEEEVCLIFGKEGDQQKRFFTIGTPLDMNTPVCIDLQGLVERSSGIFGKTGTGKTFLTRLVLAGVIAHRKAVVIIFDMHSEYGLQARSEGSDQFVKGLKTLFPDRTALFSLDPSSTARRGGQPDEVLSFPFQSIRVQDIISLQNELNLHPTACEAASLIESRYQEQWLSILLQSKTRLKELADEVGAHPESIAALYRKLKQIERYPFFYEGSGTSHDSIIEKMLGYIDRGISIIIEFGNHTSTFCYLLIANIITRRIHRLYIKKTEAFLGSRSPADEPQKLLIVIEEAHKFLNPEAAAQTIFGTIAREMRKYYVSLLIVDQRPSGIDPEVLSQIGTKIVAQLNNEKDISALLSGASNTTELRTILASLDTKKQVLVLGHATPMPIVLETEQYDDKFYKKIGGQAVSAAIFNSLFPESKIQTTAGKQKPL